MADWSTPPTPDELRLAGWDKPPTPQELADAEAIQKQNQDAKNEEEAAAKAAFLERAMQNDTAPLGTRAWLGLKKTTAGKLNFLKEKGYKAFDIKGEIVYIDENNEPHFVEKKGIDSVKEALGDVLDVSSPVIAAIPGLVVGLAAGRLKALTPLRAAVKTTGLQGLADAGGAALAQGVSAMVPGSDEMYPADRIADIGANVVAGAVPTAAMLGGRAAYNAVGPAPVYGRKIVKQVLGGGDQAAVRASVDEGLALEKQIGGPPLSASELANTQSGHGLYNALRRGQLSSDVVRESDVAHAEALDSFAHKKIAELVSNRSVTPDQAGRTAGIVWNKAVQRKRDMVSNALDAAFSRAEEEGGKIPLTNTMAVQKEIEARFGTPFSTATGDAIVNGVTQRFSKLNEMAKGSPASSPAGFLSTPVEAVPGKTPELTIRQVQNSLSQWGKAAQGSEMALENIDNKAVQRKVAVMTKNALLKDLDAAIAKAPGATSLIEARDLTKELYDEMKFMDSSLLKTAFKLEQRGSAGKVSQMIARGTFTKEEVAKGAAILRANAPDAAMDLAAGTFEAMMAPALKSGKMNPAAFNRIFTDPKKLETMAAVLGDTPAAKAFLKDLSAEVKYAERISRGGTAAGMSPTSPLQGINRVLSKVPMVGDIGAKVQEFLVPLSNPRTLAIAFTSEEGRMALLGLMKTANTGTAQNVMRSIIQLGTIIQRDSALYQDEELGYTPLPRKGDPE